MELHECYAVTQPVAASVHPFRRAEDVAKKQVSRPIAADAAAQTFNGVLREMTAVQHVMGGDGLPTAEERAHLSAYFWLTRGDPGTAEAMAALVAQFTEGDR